MDSGHNDMRGCGTAHVRRHARCYSSPDRYRAHHGAPTGLPAPHRLETLRRLPGPAGGYARSGSHQAKALCPVMSRPTMSVWISAVPS